MRVFSFSRSRSALSSWAMTLASSSSLAWRSAASLSVRFRSTRSSGTSSQPLRAVKMHAVRLHLVFTDNVIAAILHVQLQVCRPGRAGQDHESQQELPHMSVDYSSAPPVSPLRIGELARPFLRIGVQDGP